MNGVPLQPQRKGRIALVWTFQHCTIQTVTAKYNSTQIHSMYIAGSVLIITEFLLVLNVKISHNV